MKKYKQSPILLVGAGPIGIEMAIALKKSNLEYIHIEAGCLGSTIDWYSPGTSFFSSPERLSLAGVNFEVSPHLKATREEYLLYLRNLVNQFDLNIKLFTRLITIEKDKDLFKAQISRIPINKEHKTTDNTALEKHAIYAEKIILAIGDMHKPRLINIKGENSPYVSHFFPDPHILSQLQVTIVGGKNSAAEAAIRLCRVGAKVTLTYRCKDLDPIRIKPWVLPELNSLIREEKIKFIPNSTPIEIIDSNLLIQNSIGEITTIEGDYILLLTGYEQDSEFLKKLGLKLEGSENSPVINENCESSIPNIFIIGTAVAGSQYNGAKHYIETSHVHINKVLKKLGVSNYPEFFNSKIRPVNEREN